MSSLIGFAIGLGKCWRMCVCKIEVIGEFGMLGSHRWDAFDAGEDSFLLAILTNSQILFLHITTLGLQYKAGNLEITETTLLDLKQQTVWQTLKVVVFQQFMLQVDNMFQTLKEPDVNLSQLFNTLYTIAFFQSLCDGKDTQVGRISQRIIQIIETCMIVAHKAMHALTNHTQTFLNHLFERASDRHDFAHRFHGRTNQTADTGKLGKVPTGNLTNHIIEAGSDIG